MIQISITIIFVIFVFKFLYTGILRGIPYSFVLNSLLYFCLQLFLYFLLYLLLHSFYVCWVYDVYHVITTLIFVFILYICIIRCTMHYVISKFNILFLPLCFPPSNPKIVFVLYHYHCPPVHTTTHSLHYQHQPTNYLHLTSPYLPSPSLF